MTDPAAPVRIGLVGYGFGGRTFHAPLIRATPALELVGVVTTNAARIASLAEDHPGIHALDSLAALVDAGAEAVVISSTTGTHSELTDRAIDLGLHVLCDKPLAVDSDRADESLERAEAAGVLLTAYQNRRWDSDFLTARRLITDGRLGDIHRFESRFERWSPGPDRAAWRSELTPAQGGGLRLDLMTHLVDQAVTLFGDVDSVYAEIEVRRSTSISDDDLMLALRHTSGVLSHLYASKVAGDPTRRLHVNGSEGAYVVGGFDGQESALLAGRTPATEGDGWGVEAPEAWGEVRRGPDVEPVPSERGRWDLFYPAFAAAVRGEGPLPVDPHEAVRVLEILDAAAMSAAEQSVIAFG
jgi:predicted dehydrogenase